MPNPSVLTINRRYVLSEPPHSGGMADVYQAVDLQDNFRRVAIKVFKHGRLEEEILAESFRRETQALQELKHPHIVELLDSGIDPETEHYFLVMPWVERQLLELLTESPPEGWDDFWSVIGLPILSALVFSHERGCIHRDLKPSNVLIADDNQIKLVDFGISKLKRYFEPKITLAEFTSRPYTPPEHDRGDYTYTRDVYGWGAIALRCLTAIDLVDYDSIPKALKVLDVPPSVLEIIEACVSDDPAERPHNAEVLLAQLEAVQSQRLRSSKTTKGICYLKLSPKAITNLQNELNTSQPEIERILTEDLNTVCGIARYRNSKAASPDEEYPENHYALFGAAYSYHVSAKKNYLWVFNAWSLPNSVLEGKRESGWQPNYEFKFGSPLNLNDAIEVICNLKFDVVEHEATLRQTKAEEEKQRLFRVWIDLLRAKADWEKEREAPLYYSSYESDGSRVYFQLMALPDDDIVGQPRHVVRGNGSSILGGDVEEVTDDRLILYIQYGDPSQLPEASELRFDTRAAEVALSRQKAAVEAIRFNRAVRTNLRHLLIDPSTTQIPHPSQLTSFSQKLNESQKEAVESALGTEDFLLVEGPPGTGKTRFITEVILQTLLRNPDARILLSSQTHVALDNALERIQSQNLNLKLVRIGNHEKVAEGVQMLLVEEQMDRWRQYVLKTSQQFLLEWAAQRKISAQKVEQATRLQELRNITLKIDGLRAELESRKREKDNLCPFPYDSSKPKLLEQYGISEDLRERLLQLEEEIDDLNRQAKLARAEKEKIAEPIQQMSGRNIRKLLKLSVQELDAWLEKVIDLAHPDAQKLQRLLALQTEWADQFGRNDQFNTAFLKRVQVIAGTCIGMPREVQEIEFDLCIVDEASKATATEVLVPMARSHRWILVGDSNQLPPFQDEASSKAQFLSKYNLKPDDIQETLFDLLLRTLPAQCCKSLTIQHRMVQPIGELISQCFYDGRLHSEGPALDPDLIRVLPKAVTWLTTTSLPNRSEQAVRPSYNNACEVSVILQLLRRLNRVAAEAYTGAAEPQKKYEVAILTGYTAQRKLINRRLNSELESLQALHIECNTVDAFQGREADIAIYSVTRSNNRGELGFLKKRERLNVALSRGRIGLVIVGDHYFCSTALHNPLGEVLKHIERHSDSCCLTEAKL
ncbi:AAA domain-containing protein [Oscillatoria laete-virens NRMC-F 0139]|nr:serine/threonine-protein kinase [Oscillatoria laete-virens]MDL5052661.1 AAA domain-containing protein [Oscillatoria laete-virens NRMC-F 0139]